MSENVIHGKFGKEEYTAEAVLEEVNKDKAENIIVVYTTEDGHWKFRASNMTYEHLTYLKSLLDLQTLSIMAEAHTDGY